MQEKKRQGYEIHERINRKPVLPKTEDTGSMATRDLKRVIGAYYV